MATITLLLISASVSATDGTRLRGADRRRLQRQRRPANKAQSGQLCPDGSPPKRNLVTGELRCVESQSEVQARIDKRMERRNYNQGNNSPDETSEDENNRLERRNYSNGSNNSPDETSEDDNDHFERREYNKGS